MTDLVTLAQVKVYLNLPSGAGPSDAVLQTMITAYSQAVRSYCNRDFTQQSYTEQIDGPDSPRLALANGPVTSVASCSILDDQGNPTAVAVTDIRIVSNGLGCVLAWPKGWFPRGFGNIVITYTAGFATIPADLAQAVCELVGLRFRELDRIGYNSKSLAGETVSFNVKDMPASTKMILNQYRKGFFA